MLFCLFCLLLHWTISYCDDQQVRVGEGNLLLGSPEGPPRQNQSETAGSAGPEVPASQEVHRRLVPQNQPKPRTSTPSNLHDRFQQLLLLAHPPLRVRTTRLQHTTQRPGRHHPTSTCHHPRTTTHPTNIPWNPNQPSPGESQNPEGARHCDVEQIRRVARESCRKRRTFSCQTSEHPHLKLPQLPRSRHLQGQPDPFLQKGSNSNWRHLRELPGQRTGKLHRH